MSKRSLTKHHRLPKSNGGDKSKENISYISGRMHQAWHTLVSNLSPEKIADLFNEHFLPKGYKFLVVKEITTSTGGVTLRIEKCCAECGRSVVSKEYLTRLIFKKGSEEKEFVWCGWRCMRNWAFKRKYLNIRKQNPPA